MPTKQLPKHLRKKKKGPAPAHQNTFAFKHNPHSKKSDKILDLPNVHVCRRCHDKIEWRKKYRKYKPRTVPGKCNICQMKLVRAAYHTICDKCSTGDKAKTIVREHLKANEGKAETTNNNEDESAMNVDETVEGNPSNVEETPNTAEGVTTSSSQSSLAGSSTHVSTTGSTPVAVNDGRACCMCVKDFALLDSDDEHDEEDPLTSGKKLTLRQRKTLERQRDAATKKRDKRQNDDDENDNRDPEESKSDGPVDSGSDLEEEEDMDTDDDETDDPFLLAVGGSDKLLTGEAYQKALLEKEKQQQT